MEKTLKDYERKPSIEPDTGCKKIEQPNEQSKILEDLVLKTTDWLIRENNETWSEVNEMQAMLTFATVLASVGALSGIAALILTIF